ncbi:MAG: hypothetical protein ACXWDO_03875 [Bacteroidia bacterium]
MKRQIVTIPTICILAYLVFIYFAFFHSVKFIRKETADDNIKIRWYYYTHPTSLSHDFIEVKMDGQEEIIYEAEDDVVADVSIDKNLIKIALQA